MGVMCIACSITQDHDIRAACQRTPGQRPMQRTALGQDCPPQFISAQDHCDCNLSKLWQIATRIYWLDRRAPSGGSRPLNRWVTSESPRDMSQCVLEPWLIPPAY